MDLVCLDSVDSQTRTFQKVVFVYNAIMNGWSVTELGNGLYEFEKELSEIPSRYKNTNGTDVKDTFIFKFLKNNLSLQCEIQNSHQNASLGYSPK